MPGMFMCNAKVWRIDEELRSQRRCTSDTAKLQPVAASTGLRISRSTLDCGKLRTLYSQSEAEWRLYSGSIAEDSAGDGVGTLPKSARSSVLRLLFAKIDVGGGGFCCRNVPAAILFEGEKASQAGYASIVATTRDRK